MDQFLKWIICKQLSPNESRPILRGIFHITYVRNPGIVFGLHAGESIAFTILRIVVSLGLIIFTLVYALGKPYFPWKWGWVLGLIIAGVTGNLVDRLRWGYVVDFIDFRIWPVFNLADLTVLVAAIIFLSEIFRAKRI